MLSSSRFMKSIQNCRLSQMQPYPSDINKSFTQNECQLLGKVELVYPRPRSKLLPREFSPKYFSISSSKAAAASETLIQVGTLSWCNPTEFQTSEFERTTNRWSAILHKLIQEHPNTTTTSATFYSPLLIQELLCIGSPHPQFCSTWTKLLFVCTHRACIGIKWEWSATHEPNKVGS